MREAMDTLVTGADGLAMNLVDFGGDTGPPLLLLHGSLGHARGWDFVVDAMPGGQRALALDLPGHGKSAHADAAGRYAFPRLIADVGAVLATFDERVVVAGHSLGSALAMFVAAKHGVRLAGAIFMDIDPHVPQHQVDHLREVGSQPPKRYAEFDRAVSRESRVAPGAAPAVHEHLARHGYHHDGSAWVQRFDQRFLQYVERWDARDALRSVRVPALVVRGEESTVMSREARDEMLSALPDARAVEVPGAGHQLHLQEPAAVAAAIHAFLDEIRRG